jgi:tripartite-type tricarboxylate transporter receptor subunit TctC
MRIVLCMSDKSETRQTAHRGYERRLVTHHPRRRILSLAAGAAVMPAVSKLAIAQTYPTRPITLVIPFAAGGAGTTIARIMVEKMRASLGQPFIIENVPGANGSIGVGRVARAAGDGYTVVMGLWNTHVGNGALYQLSYDVLKDFEPVTKLAEYSQLLVARKNFPADDLKSFIAWLQANPDKVAQGNAGVGGTAHLAGVLFQKETGTRFQFVPYRGGGSQAMQDLVAGNIDLMFESPSICLPQVRAGSIKAYAVTAKNRLASAPDIPTVDEAGLPGFYTSNWLALFAPKATSKEVIIKLSSAAADALADPLVRQKLI